MKTATLAGVFAAAAGGALAQTAGPWTQCGGQGWSGPTTCVSGYTCVFSNNWYSQCLPGGETTLATSTTTRTTTTTTTTSTIATTTPTSTPSVPGKFKWFGINQSGAEFGEKIYPGTWGKEFIFPSRETIQVCLFFLYSSAS